MVRSLVLVVMMLSFVAFAPAAAAQEASPAASPMAVTCDAPELPPGTPTPMEDAPPAAAEDEPPAPDASPVDEEAPPAAEEGAAEVEMPAGTPASEEEVAAVEAAVMNLFACLNEGNFLGAAALMTDNFVQGFLEAPTPYDAAVGLEEGFQTIEVLSTSNPQVYADGSASIEVAFAGLYNGPGGVGSARWTFVEEDGYWKLDNYMDVAVPEGVLPDAVIIDVHLVDYAFALSQSTIPAETPVIFRTSNTSASGAPHVNVVVTFDEGTTPQQVISGEIDPFEASTGFFGAIFLEPGMSGDLAFTGLEPGTYFLVCDVETADGAPHYELGMVAQITVE